MLLKTEYITLTDQIDHTIIQEIIKGNEKQFEVLFHKYYAPLCAFAFQYLHDNDECEEVVQGFFTKLWEKRRQVQINTSVKSYFFSSIKNLCINRINHIKVKDDYAMHIKNSRASANTDNYFIEIGLKDKIDQYIEELPEKRRQIFLLSREKGMKYKEIAEHLNVSVKTVEAQMGQALKTLRDQLKDYKDLLISFFILKKI